MASSSKYTDLLNEKSNEFTCLPWTILSMSCHAMMMMTVRKQAWCTRRIHNFFSSRSQTAIWISTGSKPISFSSNKYLLSFSSFCYFSPSFCHRHRDQWWKQQTASFPSIKNTGDQGEREPHSLFLLLFFGIKWALLLITLTLREKVFHLFFFFVKHIDRCKNPRHRKLSELSQRSYVPVIWPSLSKN